MRRGLLSKFIVGRLARQFIKCKSLKLFGRAARRYFDSEVGAVVEASKPSDLSITSIERGVEISSSISNTRMEPLSLRPWTQACPLLVELDGWQGKKPDGMSMEMPNNSMTTATRDYQRGPAQLHVGIVMGQAAAGALAPLQTGINIQTSDGHMISSTMHGLPVMKTFNTKQKSGTIMVALGKNALFSLSYNGITEEEALALAEKFNWTAIQAAAQQK